MVSNMLGSKDTFLGRPGAAGGMKSPNDHRSHKRLLPLMGTLGAGRNYMGRIHNLGNRVLVSTSRPGAAGGKPPAHQPGLSVYYRRAAVSVAIRAISAACSAGVSNWKYVAHCESTALSRC